MSFDSKPHSEYPNPTPEELDEFIRGLEEAAREEGWTKPSAAPGIGGPKEKIVSDLEKDGWELVFDAPEAIFNKTKIIFPYSTNLKRIQLGNTVLIFKKSP